MTNTDYLDVVLVSTEQIANSLGLRPDSTCRSFLDKYVAALSMFKRKQNKVNCFIKGHNETRHATVGNCYWLPGADLIDPKRNYRTT